MKRLLITALISFSALTSLGVTSAEAARCRLGRIYRPSMGICQSEARVRSEGLREARHNRRALRAARRHQRRHEARVAIRRHIHERVVYRDRVVVVYKSRDELREAEARPESQAQAPLSRLLPTRPYVEATPADPVADARAVLRERMREIPSSDEVKHDLDSWYQTQSVMPARR